MSNVNSSQAPGQNKTVTIIVNGRPREVTGKTVSYEEIVKLAFPDDPSNQDIDFTVAYANPHGKDGELVYLWFDTGKPDADTHRQEIERFKAEVVNDSVVFRTATYQEVFRAIGDSEEPIVGWHRYMDRRYFAEMV